MNSEIYKLNFIFCGGGGQFVYNDKQNAVFCGGVVNLIYFFAGETQKLEKFFI